jgi:hypothetical protein
VRLAAFVSKKKGARVYFARMAQGPSARDYGFRACAKWRIHDAQLRIVE